MKALSIKQPWASLIAHGIKDIENRTWQTHFRGKIYIHASAKDAGALYELLNDQQIDAMNNHWTAAPPYPNRPISAIIGEVEIVDCIINHPSIWAEKTFMYEYDEEIGEKPIGKPIYNWVLANPVLYEKPILNVKGKLSFWEPTPNQICMSCEKEFFGHDPQYCCSGHECGCMGQAIEPVVCSEECYNELCGITTSQKCKVCGCTQNDCSQCIEKTGETCYWVEQDLCSACENIETREKLSQYGKVVRVSQSDQDYEFLITDGFSQNARNTFACMEACNKIAESYPYVKKCVTEDNRFHLILTKEKKIKASV